LNVYRSTLGLSTDCGLRRGADRVAWTISSDATPDISGSSRLYDGWAGNAIRGWRAKPECALSSGLAGHKPATVASDR
jgi:hypothetical protein